MADLGADVLKIESPAGDDTRQWGPPFVERDGDTSAAYFHACNRGKDSRVIDFRTDQGQAELKALIRDADIVIENFKVGGLAKYGLDYDSLCADNPRLIYCSITGFGQTGPYAHRAGYDYIIQGMSGLMSITGDPDGQPQRVGVAVTDIVTGLYAVNAILAAVIQRQTSGKGQQIDMSLLDSAVAFMANQNMNYLTTGQAPKRTGNYHPNLVPYQVFDYADGHIIIATGNDFQFEKICKMLGLPELVTDARFLKNADRIANREALIAAITDRTRDWTCSDLLTACEDVGIPAGPINNIEAVFNDPQVIARGLKISPEGVPGVRSPFQFSDAELALDKAAPKLRREDL